MELVAVVCIESSHYVAFVRCGDSTVSPWCFFDSMADRKGELNGYNIPELSPAPDVERILSDVGAEEIKNNPSVELGDKGKRFVSDAYMCIYQPVRSPVASDTRLLNPFYSPARKSSSSSKKGVGPTNSSTAINSTSTAKSVKSSLLKKISQKLLQDVD